MITYSSGVEYGNNVPVQGWIEIDATFDDWCKLVHQPFFRELAEYLEREGILKEDSWLGLLPSTQAVQQTPTSGSVGLYEWISGLTHRES